MRRTTLVFVLAALALTGCKRQLDHDKLVGIIKDGCAEKGLTLKSVSCPDDRPIKKDDTFACTAVSAEDQKVTISITQMDSEGTVKWNLEGMILQLDKIQADVVSKVGAVDIHCPRKQAVMQIGEKLTCDIPGQGVEHKIDISMDTATGNVSWKIK